MNDEPNLSAEEMIERLAPMLSPRQRLRGIVALVSGSAGTICLASLWVTEPTALPGHTRFAFAAFILLCLAWAGYGGWVVARQTPLFALDRVIAAWITLTASITTSAIIIAVAADRGSGLIPALPAGAVLIAASAALVLRAHIRRAMLLRRKRELTGRDTP
ncbi:hypothetical protein [Planobispora takensis]|uniref:Transmembrane transport protein n=1 Tax=Planobispora takensis TaxID=1367882 RepID=A0A8J3SW74_9ACTN|nr:hypothetical protein [Planobispora takensis]GII01637.1 hypothetical protein Pta02_36450 [Planobispora takensis]